MQQCYVLITHKASNHIIRDKLLFLSSGTNYNLFSFPVSSIYKKITTYHKWYCYTKQIHYPYLPQGNKRRALYNPCKYSFVHVVYCYLQLHCKNEIDFLRLQYLSMFIAPKQIPMRVSVKSVTATLLYWSILKYHASYNAIKKTQIK